MDDKNEYLRMSSKELQQCSLCGMDDEHLPSVEVPFCWYCGSPMKAKPKGEDDAEVH